MERQRRRRQQLQQRQLCRLRGGEKEEEVEEGRIKPLSNYDIQSLIVQLKIPNFVGVFMRDTLSRKRATPRKRECWILNHGSSQTEGSHWTALAKKNDIAFYFDSFGKLPPPLEVIDYLGANTQLYYNVKRYQHYGTAICGHLCLRFLHNFWMGVENI